MELDETRPGRGWTPAALALAVGRAIVVMVGAHGAGLAAMYLVVGLVHPGMSPFDHVFVALVVVPVVHVPTSLVAGVVAAHLVMPSGRWVLFGLGLSAAPVASFLVCTSFAAFGWVCWVVLTVLAVGAVTAELGVVRRPDGRWGQANSTPS